MMLLIKALKKIFFLIIFLVLFIILSLLAYRFDNYATFPWEAKIRWGHGPFDSIKFREVPTNEKASMIADLMLQEYFIGKPAIEVTKTMGERTGGYYNYDINLTYRIYEKGRTAWDLVFIVDYETQKVTQVFAYRQHGGMTRMVLYSFIGLIDRVF